MECPVCYSEYDKHVYRPKINTCGHTICEVCIRMIHQCCICKHPIIKQYDNMHNIRSIGRNVVYKDNFALMEMIDKYKNSNRNWCAQCSCMMSREDDDDTHRDHVVYCVHKDMYNVYEGMNVICSDINIMYNKCVDNIQLLDSVQSNHLHTRTTISTDINKLIDDHLVRVEVLREDIMRSFSISYDKYVQRIDSIHNEHVSYRDILNDIHEDVNKHRDTLIDSNVVYSNDIIEYYNKIKEKMKETMDNIDRYDIEDVCKMVNPVDEYKPILERVFQNEHVRDNIFYDDRFSDRDISNPRMNRRLSDDDYVIRDEPLDLNQRIISIFPHDDNQDEEINDMRSNSDDIHTFDFSMDGIDDNSDNLPSF